MIPLWSAVIGGLVGGGIVAWVAYLDGRRRGGDIALAWCYRVSRDLHVQMEKAYAKTGGHVVTMPDYTKGAALVADAVLDRRIARPTWWLP